MKDKCIFISKNLNTVYSTLFCSRVIRTILISLIYDLDIFANDPNTQYFFVIVVIKRKLHPQLSVSVYILVMDDIQKIILLEILIVTFWNIILESNRSPYLKYYVTKMRYN